MMSAPNRRGRLSKSQSTSMLSAPGAGSHDRHSTSPAGGLVTGPRQRRRRAATTAPVTESCRRPRLRSGRAEVTCFAEQSVQIGRASCRAGAKVAALGGGVQKQQLNAEKLAERVAERGGRD